VQALHDFELNVLIGCPYDEIAGRDFDAAVADAKALATARGQLDAHVQIVVAMHVLPGSLSGAGVADRLDDFRAG
jgi:hypothetical protein